MSRYMVTGDKDQVKGLYSVMRELEKMDSPGLHENGFGSAWLGNLVVRLGGNYNKIYCRGSWFDLQLLSDDLLHFSVEAAWGEPFEVRQLLEETFPGIKIYYECSEPGMAVYETNDAEKKYFKDRYCLWTDRDGEEYYETLESLIKAVKKITGKTKLKTFQDCLKALDETHEIEYSLNEYKIRDN